MVRDSSCPRNQLCTWGILIAGPIIDRFFLFSTPETDGDVRMVGGGSNLGFFVCLRLSVCHLSRGCIVCMLCTDTKPELCANCSSYSKLTLELMKKVSPRENQGKTTSTDVIDIGIDLIGGRLSFNLCGEEYHWWVGVRG